MASPPMRTVEVHGDALLDRKGQDRTPLRASSSWEPILENGQSFATPPTLPRAARPHAEKASNALAPVCMAFVAQQFVLRDLVPSAGDTLRSALLLWRDAVANERRLWRCRIAAVSRRVHRLARRVFEAWHSETLARDEWWETIRSVLRWAARRIQNRAFAAWTEYAAMTRSKTARLALAIHARAATLQRAALSGWRASLAFSKEQSAWSSSMHSKLSAMAARWQTGAALGAWRAEVVGPARALQAAKGAAAARRTRRTLRVALRRLAENVDRSQLRGIREENVRRCNATHDAHLLALALDAWLAVVLPPHPPSTPFTLHPSLHPFPHPLHTLNLEPFASPMKPLDPPLNINPPLTLNPPITP